LCYGGKETFFKTNLSYANITWRRLTMNEFDVEDMWNDSDRGKYKCLDKTCPNATFSTHNLHGPTLDWTRAACL